MIVTKEFLQSLVGKTIMFNKGAEEFENYTEAGMKAVVTRYGYDDRDNDPLHKLYYNLEPFEDHNHKLQNSNFYDPNTGRYDITALMAGYYVPVDWCYLNGDCELPFDVVPEISKNEWNDVATIPRDGTVVDVWCNHELNRNNYVRFTDVKMRGDGTGFGFIVHLPDDGILWEYLERNEGIYPKWDITHWKHIDGGPFND